MGKATTFEIHESKLLYWGDALGTLMESIYRAAGISMPPKPSTCAKTAGKCLKTKNKKPAPAAKSKSKAKPAAKPDKKSSGLPPEYKTLAELAEKFHVKQTTLKSACNYGRMQFRVSKNKHAGKKIRYATEAAVKKYLEKKRG